MRRKGKHTIQLHKMKVFEIYTISLIFVTLFMSIAYAKITSVGLQVTGKVEATKQDGIFISDVAKTTSTGLISEEVKYFNKTALSTTIQLSTSSSSAITYKVSLFNNSGSKQYFKGVSYVNEGYDNNNIIYSLSGMEEYVTTIDNGKSLDFNLIFKYKNGASISSNQTLNSILNFDFSNEFIEFKIGTKIYKTPKGATWEQFIKSEYNTYGFYIENNKIYTPEKKVLLYTDKANNITGQEVKKTDKILTTVTYIPSPTITLDKNEITYIIRTNETKSETLTATIDNTDLELKWEVEPASNGITISGTGKTRTITVNKKVEGAKIKVSYGAANAVCEIIIKAETREILTASTTNSTSLELTEGYEEPLNNYRIYGTSTGIGDKINLFDMKSITKFYDSSGKIITTDTISDGVITSNTSYGGNCNSNITSLNPGKYVLSADVLYDSTNKDTRFVRIGYRDGSMKSYTQTNGLQFFLKKWVRIYYRFELLEETPIFGFIFGNTTANTNTLFKNIDLRKEENFIQPAGYTPYEGYKIKVRTQNSRNLFNIDSVSMFYYNEFYKTTDGAFNGIAIGNEDKSISYIEDDIITSMAGIWTYPTFCNSNITKLEAGIYTLSAEAMSNKDSGNTTGRIGLITNDGTTYFQNINVYEHKVWKKVSYTFTLESDTDIRGFQFQGYENEGANMKFKNIQLEKGSTATEYQENNEYEITISSPLKEGDYIDFKQGKVIRSNGTQETIELPQMQAYNEYTKFEVVTENVPSRIDVEYVGCVFK